METNTDFDAAIGNAATFLDAAAAITHEKDAATLALVGSGWASLALALSQDRKVHIVAESVASWLRQPTSEGFDQVIKATMDWAGIIPPEYEFGSSEPEDSAPGPARTDQEGHTPQEQATPSEADPLPETDQG